MSVYETLWRQMIRTHFVRLIRRVKLACQIAAPVTTHANHCHRLLDHLLVGMAAVSLLALIVSPVVGWQTTSGKALLTTSLALLTGAAAAFAVNRRSIHLASVLFLTFLTVILIAVGAGTVELSIPILLASVLLRPWASMVMAVLDVLLKVSFAFGPSGHPLDMPLLLALLTVALVSWLVTGGMEQATRDLRQSEQHIRQMEERLHQSQKMEAIGHLTAGVAHDYNNYLTVMDSYACLLLDEMRPDEPKREMVAQIQRAVEQSRALTRQLLAFSRRRPDLPAQRLHPQTVCVNEVIARAEGILRRLAGKNVDLVIQCDPDTGAVRADPGQIEQVLLNLMTNARDAIAGTGMIVIRTANVELNRMSGEPIAPAPYVMIAVSDTGAGIDAETLPHIFEPFFTTKEDGAGTGLGLSTVCDIVRQSGGHVEVESELGRGTTFKVYLPRIAEE